VVLLQILDDLYVLDKVLYGTADYGQSEYIGSVIPSGCREVANEAIRRIIQKGAGRCMMRLSQILFWPNQLVSMSDAENRGRKSNRVDSAASICRKGFIFRRRRRAISETSGLSR
jgi:hypothetical protein